MKNLIKKFTIFALMGTFFVGCGDMELRTGKALQEHYDYQAYVIDAINDDSQNNVNVYDGNGDLICHESHESPYLEMPSYCEQFPGLECCTWQDTRENSVCEVEWCRWNNACEWEWQEMICF